MKKAIILLLIITTSLFAEDNDYKKWNQDDIKKAIELLGIDIFKFKSDPFPGKYYIDITYEEYLDKKIIDTDTITNGLPNIYKDMNLVVDDTTSPIIKFFCNDLNDSTYNLNIEIGGVTLTNSVTFDNESIGSSDWWEFWDTKIVPGKKTPLIMKYANDKNKNTLDCPSYRNYQECVKYFKYCYIVFVELKLISENESSTKANN